MKIARRIISWFYSISGRLFISHILVGAFTPLLIALLVALFALLLAFTFTPHDYRTFAEDVAILWLLPKSDAATRILNSETTTFTPPGYAIVVNPVGQIRFVKGRGPCSVGEMMQTCAPHFINQPEGEMMTDIGDENWIDIHVPLSTGDRILARYASPTTANIGAWLVKALPETFASILQIAFLLALVAIPISAVLVGVFARPFLRRINHIAQASQHFANGDLEARVLDTNHDEVSTLARQFDTMADVLQQNIYTLRDLLKSNAELTVQAEQTAIQSERLRLARDLHDELAQQLFSLSASSAAIPDMIMQDATTAQIQARQVAMLAEKTLIGLRSLLVDLRPGGLLEMGLVQGLKALCAEWKQQYRIGLELSITVTHERFSAPLQTAVYQIAHESLSNVAKHAHATHVQVTLIEGRQQLILSISDNGNGLQPDDLHKEGHFGVISMRERAEALGGDLFVGSETGTGMTVRAKFSLAAIA